MSRKQHVVRLSSDDRRSLQQLVAARTTPQAAAMRARVLLQADADHRQSARFDRAIAADLGIAERTVARIRADWTARGVNCVHRKPQAQPSRPPKLADAQVLQIVALSVSAPPPGYARWSLRLLANQAVAVEIVDSITPETIRRAIKRGASLPSAGPSAS